jgi:hypothetical protein
MTMGRYAKETDVPVMRSRDEIVQTLLRYGVTERAFIDMHDRAAIQFKLEGRSIRFVLPLPNANDRTFTHQRQNQYDQEGKPRPPAQARAAWEQACRQKWRALALAIKAKLETVESEIATIDEEFMAYLVMPDGKTVAEHALPAITQARTTGTVPPLLGFAPGEGRS